MRHPLAVALAISAAVHLGVLGVLLVGRPRGQAPSPMRVHVLDGAPAHPSAASIPSAPNDSEQVAAPRPRAVTRPEASPAYAERAPAASVRAARPSTEPTQAARENSVPPTEPATVGSGTAAPDAERPRYQDDIWVLTDEASGGGAPAASPSEEPGAPRGTVSPQGALPGGGTGGSGPSSLLGELSARLARSAARCTPTGVVRSSRGSAPEVPLHFCLDATGRPSSVGLEGTTGSELLDRAARECVVPGAAPLPPLPGCYTVAVRFPVRG
jgi:hypothetical protein